MKTDRRSLLASLTALPVLAKVLRFNGAHRPQWPLTMEQDVFPVGQPETRISFGLSHRVEPGSRIHVCAPEMDLNHDVIVRACTPVRLETNPLWRVSGVVVT